MKRINLMHLTFSLDVGGLENVVLSLLKQIDRNRYCPMVCSLTSRAALSGEFEQCGIPVYRLDKKIGIDFSLPIRLSRLLKENKVDILHTHNSGPFFYGFLGAKFSGVSALVHTAHSHLRNNHRFLGKTLSLFSMGFNRIISDSDAVTDHLIDDVGITSGKITTIYNGIDTDLYSTSKGDSSLLADAGIPPGSRVIGTVGRLENEKDQATLLMAFQKVCQWVPNVCLVMVGDGSLRQALTEKSRALNIDRRVFFLGSRRDVHRILPLFDLFVLSSKSEGLPLSILEAMAAHVPVIATAVGGIPEIIRHGETGWLVPPGDLNAMSKAIIELLADRKQAGGLEAAAFKTVVDRFSLVAMSSQYDAIYQSCGRRASRKP